MLKGGVIHRFIEAAAMFLVAALSLLLLLYVGFGDGRRNYETIHIEKLTAHGRFLESSIDNFLRDGLPLKQYVGFSTLAAPIVDSEDVDAVAVYDQSGKQLFIAIDKTKPTLPPPPSELIKNPADVIKIHTGNTHYQVVLPLRTRFETVGSVVVVSPKSLVTGRIWADFLPLLIIAGVLAIAFTLLVVVAKSYISRSPKPWLQIAYGAMFFFLSLVVVWTLGGLYFDGIQGKAKASETALAQRLSDIGHFKLDVKDFNGLDKSFAAFKRLNTEVNDANLLVDNISEISTDQRQLGKQWTPDAGEYEYKIDLSPPDQPQHMSLAVTVLKSVILQRVARSVKNFAALFIASAFLSALFLQIADSIQRLKLNEPEVEQAAGGQAQLLIIKPIYFLAVFLDSLTYSFLPKFMQETALASGVSVGFASLPFTAYYLCFALSLIPAATLADRHGPKPVIVAGLSLAAASVLCLALPFGIWEMVALRGLAGIGQGVLMIGVQTYILAVVSPEKKTQGTAIIVFGFQSALISGMALGSLMVSFLDPVDVFAIAGGVGSLAVVYTLSLMPRSKPKRTDSGLKAAITKLANELKKVMTSAEFLRTLLCIGAPAKAVLTGVVTFALPLILGQAGYRPEDIGQMVMLYGLGVLASSGYVSRLVDRTKNSEMVLFTGAAMSGIGLMTIGLMGSAVLGNGLVSTIVVVISVFVVGIAHGFINAPVVSHVGQSGLAKRVGANPVMTAYRFVERGGHVAGPILVAQFFLIWGQGPLVVGGIGAAIMLLGLVFVAHRLIPRLTQPTPEPAE